MSRFDTKSKQYSNPISLVVIAVIILVSWQISTLFLPTKGPFDILVYWEATTGVYLFQTIVSVSVPIILSFLGFGILLYVGFRILTLINWKKMLRTLQLFQNIAPQEIQTLLPITGIEVTSLPFQQSQIDSENLTDTFFTPNLDNPYQFSHWVALNNELKEATFEINVDSEVKIRFWVPRAEGTDDLDLLYSSLKTNSYGFQFQPAPPLVVTEIFGSNPYDSVVQREYVKFGNEFISVILLKGIPRSSFDFAQLDRLIHAILEKDIHASFIVNFVPAKTPRKKQENSHESNSRKFDWVSFSNKGIDQITKEEQSIGFWAVSAFLVVRSEEEITHLSKVKSTKIILETVFLDPLNPIKTKILKGYKLQRALTRIFDRKGIGKTGVLSSRQLSNFIHFPKEAQPGYTRKHSPIFELPPPRQTQIELFQVMKGDRELYPVGLDLSHFTTHMVVAGQTGKGKTRFVANIVNQIQKTNEIGITIFDWKGEYEGLMRTVYKIGLESCPLKINLFETHGLENVGQYVQNLVALFRELLRSDLDNNLTSQMERILRESLTEYLNQGVGNYDDYEVFLSKWIIQHRKRFSHPESSTAGLINRFGTLFRGRLGYVFNTSVTTIDFESFLSDQVCLNLSNLASYNKEDARLFLNALLLVIRTYLFRRFSDRLRYLVIAEEAQYLVPEVFTKRSSADASPAEDITLFQRAYGAGLIAVTTRPNLISRNILANSGSKIFFQCPVDSNLVGEIINLTTEQRQFVSLMPERIIVAHLPWFEHPFKGKVSLFNLPESGSIKRKSNFTQHTSPEPSILQIRKSSSSEFDTLRPLERHFLDLVSTALHEHQILHRIFRINRQIAIDIPRLQILIIFIETPEELTQIEMIKPLRSISAILIFCPPIIKTDIQNRLIYLSTNLFRSQEFRTKIHLSSLTRRGIKKATQHIKTGQLQKLSINNQLYSQHQLLSEDVVSE